MSHSERSEMKCRGVEGSVPKKRKRILRRATAWHKLLSACPRQAGIRRFAALCSTLRMTEKGRATSLGAAGGRRSQGAVCAAVDKIEEKRKPEDFIGHRNRADSPLTKMLVKRRNKYVRRKERLWSNT